MKFSLNYLFALNYLYSLHRNNKKINLNVKNNAKSMLMIAMLLLPPAMAKCSGFLTPIIVGHVPLELSRIVFYAIQHGCVFSGKVQKERPVRSPLTQGGLEIFVQYLPRGVVGLGSIV